MGHWVWIVEKQQQFLNHTGKHGLEGWEPDLLCVSK